MCNPGYILNKGLNRCIPVPGFYIPFIFLAVAVAWTVYAVVLYKKGKIEDRYSLITQLISLYVLIQTLTYFVMFCLSIALDYKLVTAIHLTTLFSMIITNVAFTLFFHLKVRKEDQPFRYWSDINKKTYKIIKWLMFIYSFKCVRLFYCKINGIKPELNAPFENKYKKIVRPLFITTVINFILQAGPIVLMDAYNLMFIPWGYQIMVMSIDNMILALAIFILEIIEFAYFKRRAIDEGELLYNGDGGKQFLKVGRAGMNVFGAAGEGPDDDNSMMYLNGHRAN